MPVYATHEEMNNGFTPAGNVLAAPSGFDVPLPEGTNPAPQQDEPSVWSAAFRQNNLLGEMFRPAKQFEPVDGYNPYADKTELHGYEQWGSAFADSRSPEETAWLKQQIDDENEDRRVLSEAGGRVFSPALPPGLLTRLQ